MVERAAVRRRRTGDGPGTAVGYLAVGPSRISQRYTQCIPRVSGASRERQILKYILSCVNYADNSRDMLVAGPKRDGRICDGVVG